MFGNEKEQDSAKDNKEIKEDASLQECLATYDIVNHGDTRSLSWNTPSSSQAAEYSDPFIQSVLALRKIHGHKPYLPMSDSSEDSTLIGSPATAEQAVTPPATTFTCTSSAIPEELLYTPASTYYFAHLINSKALTGYVELGNHTPLSPYLSAESVKNLGGLDKDPKANTPSQTETSLTRDSTTPSPIPMAALTDEDDESCFSIFNCWFNGCC